MSFMGTVFWGYFFAFHLFNVVSNNPILQRVVMAITRNGTLPFLSSKLLNLSKMLNSTIGRFTFQRHGTLSHTSKRKPGTHTSVFATKKSKGNIYFLQEQRWCGSRFLSSSLCTTSHWLPSRCTAARWTLTANCRSSATTCSRPSLWFWDMASLVNCSRYAKSSNFFPYARTQSWCCFRCSCWDVDSEPTFFLTYPLSLPSGCLKLKFPLEKLTDHITSQDTQNPHIAVCFSFSHFRKWSLTTKLK